MCMEIYLPPPKVVAKLRSVGERPSTDGVEIVRARRGDSGMQRRGFITVSDSCCEMAASWCVIHIEGS
jgi:hypothetical protein